MRAAVVATVVAASLCASVRARAGEYAISVAAGVRCFDARLGDSCLTAQTVALVGRYGEVHGSFLANDFPDGAGIVVGAAWGGDLGTRFYRFARDRVRFALRLTLDFGIVRHQPPGARELFDVDWATFVFGPQLWIRLSPAAFFLVRAAAGGNFLIFDVDPPYVSGPLKVLPAVDAAVGFGFDLSP